MKSNGIWTFITAVAVALIVSSSAVFISFQYSQTQKDIANSQAQAMKDSAAEIRQGLNVIGKGLCQTSDRQFVLCGN